MGNNLEEDLSRWVDNGLIDASQATRISAFEASSPQGLPIAMEAVGYLGGVLTFAAIIGLVAFFWDQLGVVSQTALIGAVTLLFLVGGFALDPNAQASARRLRSALWAFSTVGLVGTVATVWSNRVGATSSDVAVVTSLVTLAYASFLWWRLRAGLQHALAFAALVATLISLMADGPSLSPSWFSLGLWILGVVWFLFAWAHEEPPSFDYLLGSATAVVAVQASALDFPALGTSWGVATSVVVIAAAIGLKKTELLVVGTLGLLLFIPQACAHWIGGSLAASLGLLFAGLIVIAIAVGKIRAKANT